MLPIVPCHESHFDQGCESIQTWMKPIDVLVVGPGLGRNEVMLKAALYAMKVARDMKIPVIVDGDGLWALNMDIDVLSGYEDAILTPNRVEYQRLKEKVLGITKDDEKDSKQSITNEKSSKQSSNDQKSSKQGKTSKSDSVSKEEIVEVSEISVRLGGLTIVKKGYVDIITNGKEVALCEVETGKKRCGGQGDILTGSIATFVAWGVNASQSSDKISRNIVASYAGCAIVRSSVSVAYFRYGFSMVTSQAAKFIPVALYKLGFTTAQYMIMK